MTEGPINTLETPGEFDALAKLRPDEPYFMLLGRDRSAPELVQLWADGNRKKAFAEHHAGTINDNDLDRELRQSTDAERQGWAMKTYKRGEDRDKASGQLALSSYTEHELPAETQRRDALQRHRSRAVSAIHNAIAELADLAPLLGQETFDGIAAQELIDQLKDAAGQIKPRVPVAA